MPAWCRFGRPGTLVPGAAFHRCRAAMLCVRPQAYHRHGIFLPKSGISALLFAATEVMDVIDATDHRCHGPPRPLRAKIAASEGIGDGEQNELAPTYPRGLEVQSPVMTDNKVVPFPTPDVSLEPEPISKRHRRVIFSIGTQRLAMDFYCQVTELNPTPAPVIPVDRGKP